MLDDGLLTRFPRPRRTGIAAEVAVLRNLLSGSAEGLRKTIAEGTAVP